MVDKYELQPCFPFGKTKALTFSFDDGKTADRKLIRIFDKYRVKGTFHLNSGKMLEVNDGPMEEYFGSYLPKKDIKPLYCRHEVASHTSTHPYLTKLSDDEVLDEILSDRQVLEKCSKTLVTGFSYPFGDYDERIKKLLVQSGIKYARTVSNTGKFELPEDLLEWNPTCHYENASEYVDAFLNDKSGKPMLFYVWGHSYEIDAHEKWGYFRTILDKLGGHNDIWYATNKEIASYIAALKNLEISVDGKTIYNPNVQDIWCIMNGNVVEISSDEYFEIK